MKLWKNANLNETKPYVFELVTSAGCMCEYNKLEVKNTFLLLSAKVLHSIHSTKQQIPNIESIKCNVLKIRIL